MAATAVSTWQAVVARDKQHQAEADRHRAKTAEGEASTNFERASEAEQRATTEAAIARAVKDFLQNDLLRQVNSLPKDSDQFTANPRLTVREALDRAAARIGDRFNGQPSVEAAIRMAIGQSLMSLGLYLLARTHYEKAVAVRRATLGTDHPETLASMERLIGNYDISDRSRDAVIPARRSFQYL